MSKAAYWQRGESLDYVNAGDTMIEAGSVVALAERVGIAGDNIAPGKTGSLHVSGVYRFDKTSKNAIQMGTEVYFDGTGITEAPAAGGTGAEEETEESGTAEDAKGDGAVKAGYAAEEAAAESTTILVKLLG